MHYSCHPEAPKAYLARSACLEWFRPRWSAMVRHSQHPVLTNHNLHLVSSPFNVSTPCGKSMQLAVLYARHHSVHPSERKFGIPQKKHPVVVWRAFVTVTMNRETPISSFTLAARLSFSVLIHVLGIAPIKVPFSIPIRSALRRWNYFWRAPILETL